MKTTVRGDTEAVAVVSRQVEDLLARSPAFARLPTAHRRQIATDTVRIAGYLVAPEATRAHTLPGAVTAVSAGSFLENVDFPSFVRGLVAGVFQAIVNASVKQMEAYGRLVKDIAATVDEFASDNVTDSAAREYISSLFAEYFECHPPARCRKLRLRAGVNVSEAIGRLSTLPLEENLTTLDDFEITNTLLPAARRQLAVSRQQVLASMVLMGINRIVVTDGAIQSAVKSVIASMAKRK